MVLPTILKKALRILRCFIRVILVLLVVLLVLVILYSTSTDHRSQPAAIADLDQTGGPRRIAAVDYKKLEAEFFIHFSCRLMGQDELIRQSDT